MLVLPKEEYQEEFGCDPTIEEMSSILGINEKHVRAAISAATKKKAISIDTPVGDEGNRTIGDLIPDYGTQNIEDILDNEKMKEKIIIALRKLSKREEVVLRLRFGLSQTLDDDQNIYDIEE